MDLSEILRARLEELDQRQLFRDPKDDSRRRASEAANRLQLRLLDASSNDYLGFAQTACAVDAAGGAGASRLIHGSRVEHIAAERALADWLGSPAALLFSSGYAANVGTLAALLTRNDRVHSDALNHASLIDGMRLSQAQRKIYPHNDLETLRAHLKEPCAGQRWVVSESYFSMDADGPDLHLLHSICHAAGAFLVIDEAHALGTLGPSGAGLCAAARAATPDMSENLRPDVLIGTLGKSLGLMGAFAVGSERLRTYLWNRARSFVFSTALSPLLAAQIPERVAQVAAADPARRRLEAIRQELLRSMPDSLRRRIPTTQAGPILPIVLGTTEITVRASRWLADQGILTQAIRPPTVPASTARLRFTLQATWSDTDVLRLSVALRELAQFLANDTMPNQQGTSHRQSGTP